MSTNILTIKDLVVTETKTQQNLLHGIGLRVPKGQVVGVIGESGSGKSITMKSLMGLLPDRTAAQWSSYTFEGQEVSNPEQLPVAMIFQDPMTSLNPLRTIGYHLFEVIRRFRKLSGAEAEALAVEELDRVGIPDPKRCLKQYPHELSGGMRQRVMIAMALASKPQLLIADEPTTALDVTIQAQILALIRSLQQANQLSVLLVTHDFGVVAGMCDFVVVVYEGHIVEEGTVYDIFYHAAHPYTKQLLAAAQLSSKHQMAQEVERITPPVGGHPQQLSPTHRVWRQEAANE